MYGGVVGPALDALALRFKQQSPNMKKKKGATPPEMDRLSKEVVAPFKSAYKSLQASFEK